jgi:hypothetical protein
MANEDYYAKKAQECATLAASATDHTEARLYRALERDFLSKAADAKEGDTARPVRGTRRPGGRSRHR